MTNDNNISRRKPKARKVRASGKTAEIRKPEKVDAGEPTPPELPLKQRMKRALAGKNTIGQILGGMVDIAQDFIPGGRGIGRIINAIRIKLKGDMAKQRNIRKKGFWKWLKSRLTESSTYEGMALAIGMVWYSVDPAALEAIGTSVVSVIAGVRMIRKDKEDEE